MIDDDNDELNPTANSIFRGAKKNETEISRLNK